MTTLCREDVILGTGAHVRCLGKGRKERCTPLAKQSADALQRWLREPRRGADDVVFPSARGSRLSADGVQFLLANHLATAQQQCPSLKKKRVTPHVLRHTAAMELLQAGVDRSVIALWLGHESIETTQIYLDADLALKEKALAKTTPVAEEQKCSSLSARRQIAGFPQEPVAILGLCRVRQSPGLWRWPSFQVVVERVKIYSA